LEADDVAGATDPRSDGATGATDGLGGAGRIVRAFGALLGVHVEHARDEALTDARRLTSALVLALAAAVFGALGVAFLHVVVVALLRNRLGLPTLEACGLVAVLDLVVSALLLGRAKARLAEPVLVKTRALVRRTVASLTEP
jgi:hypothetical protein